MAENPRRSGVFLDFDGTLAAIVEDPETARPLPGAVEVVDRLAAELGLVAVVSGRPVAFLQRVLPVSPVVRFYGLYGLETVRDGIASDRTANERWRRIVDDGATTAELELPRAVRVERKGISFVLHYRGAPEYRPVVEDWAARYARTSGLDAQAGRMAVELGPFAEADKGAVVATAARGLHAAVIFGDDVGDVPAFRALDRAAGSEGVRAVKVAVRSTELPPALGALADHVVDGPDGVLSALREILDQASIARS